MTTISDAFTLYNRLETHLKRASSDRPLTVMRAFNLSDIKELADAPHNVQTAFESLTRKKLVTKVLMGDREREGFDKNSKVAYFWTPEKVAEHVPPLSSAAGIRYPNRKKPTKPRPRPANQLNAPAIDIPTDQTAAAMEKARVMLTQMVKPPADTGIRLDFGGGKVFTAPEGSEVNVVTGESGSLVVSFRLPATGN